jgi:hypothetical protein
MAAIESKPLDLSGLLLLSSSGKVSTLVARLPPPQFTMVGLSPRLLALVFAPPKLAPPHAAAIRTSPLATVTLCLRVTPPSGALSPPATPPLAPPSLRGAPPPPPKPLPRPCPPRPAAPTLTAAFRLAQTEQPRLLFPSAPGTGARVASGFSPLRFFGGEGAGGAAAAISGKALR